MTAVFICQHCTGHLFGHAPGCPVSKAMIEWRVAALAARPVPDSGPADEAAEFAARAAMLVRSGPDDATVPLALVSIALSLAALAAKETR